MLIYDEKKLHFDYLQYLYIGHVHGLISDRYITC